MCNESTVPLRDLCDVPYIESSVAGCLCGWMIVSFAVYVRSFDVAQSFIRRSSARGELLRSKFYA